MVNELFVKKNYENGTFSFAPDNRLCNQAKDVPMKYGVYIIHKGNSKCFSINDILYIGKSGTIEQNGEFKPWNLHNRITKGKQEKKSRQNFFNDKMKESKIKIIYIRWFITVDSSHNDIPGYVEARLIQKYYKEKQSLPPWNKHF